MKLIVIFCFLLTVFVGTAQNDKDISWYDLAPKFEFDDPFTKLTQDQLYNLSQVAKYREKMAPIDKDSRIKKQQKIDSLEQVLIDENIDIDGLLNLRAEITRLRKNRAEAINDSINNIDVRISGYILPLNFEDKKTTKFLLVPYVGACIHAPAPPKNQIIYLESEEGFEIKTAYDAVTVKGLIQIEDKSSYLYFVDGSDYIATGYSILDADIEKYKH